jgi:hypothetical protein
MRQTDYLSQKEIIVSLSSFRQRSSLFNEIRPSPYIQIYLSYGSFRTVREASPHLLQGNFAAVVLTSHTLSGERHDDPHWALNNV